MMSSVVLAACVGTGCAIVNGLSSDSSDAEAREPCSAHRDCYGYCSTEGCMSFQDITWYTSFLPCDNDYRKCNLQTYPSFYGLTCPSRTPCTCVNDTCLASTGVSCQTNSDCRAWQFCNITDLTCTYTFNCTEDEDCGTGLCSTSGCSYATPGQKECDATHPCGGLAVCINDAYCWRLTTQSCLKSSECGDGGVCGVPWGGVCLQEVLP